MLTPSSSQASCSSRDGSLHHMMLQLDRKISEISYLKNQISQRMQSQELEQSMRRQEMTREKQRENVIYTRVIELAGLYRKQMRQQIQQDLQAFYNENREITLGIANFYEHEIKKYKAYYQGQIWDLRQEIKRQYKVIAMMKQEVEDLMVLMKYKEEQEMNEQFYGDRSDNEEFTLRENRQNTSTRNHRLPLNGLDTRDRSGDLDVIEEQTQRTMQSSERSNGNQFQSNECGTGFIKIQQKQDEESHTVEHTQEKNNGKITSSNQKYEPNYSNSNEKGPELQNFHKIQTNALIYDEFCQALTPQQSDRKCTQSNHKVQSIFHLNSVSLYQQSSKQEEKQKKDLVNYSKEERQSDKKIKLHTAPSIQHRADHLQSIFFLDDQPLTLNKTSKMQNTNKSTPSGIHFDIKNSLKTLLYGYKLEHNDTQSKPRNEYDSENFTKSCSGKYIKKHKEMSKQDTNNYILKKFNKVVNIGQFQSSSSMPVSTKNKELSELSSNIESESSSQRNIIQNKAKNKQFLEEVLRNIHHNPKKNSTKLEKSSKNINKRRNIQSQIQQAQNFVTGVMTFGKSNLNSSSHNSLSYKDESFSSKGKQNMGLIQKQRGRDSQAKQNCMKAVDHMLKQMENNNKFVTGSKKLELKYEGEKKNGVKNGNGIVYYSNGLCYQGQFKDGMRHGYGALRLNTVEIYRGDWANDQIQGQGKIRNCAIINNHKTIYSNQNPLGKWISYHGEFKNSKFDGQGTLRLQGGQKFIGTFVKGYACGQGSLCKKTGDVEQGIWQNSIMISKHSRNQ